MSHFSVLVIGSNPEEQLAPYQENNMDTCPKQYLEFHDTEEEYLEEYEDNPELKEKYPTFEDFATVWHGKKGRDPEKGRYGYWENPNKKWDWYVLGGRWAGYFKLKSDASGLLGSRYNIANEYEEVSGGKADAALLKDIDFEGMRVEAEQKAREKYNCLKRLLGGSIPKTEYTWKQITDKDSPFKDKTIDEKREIYWSQPTKVALTKARNQSGISKEDERFLFWVEIEEYQCTEDEFAHKARLNAIATFAVVKDGKWYERGSMGWFATVSNEKETSSWQEEFNKLIDGLAPDTLLSVYDCHI